MKSLRLQWDKDYGVATRTGWSICVNGSVVCAFEPSLISALARALADQQVNIADVRDLAGRSTEDIQTALAIGHGITILQRHIETTEGVS